MNEQEINNHVLQQIRKTRASIKIVWSYLSQQKKEQLANLMNIDLLIEIGLLNKKGC